MLFPLASLKPDVARRVSLWEWEVVTATEAVGVLLDRFAFAVLDFPAELPAIAEALDTIPPALMADLSGGWIAAGSRPVGGIGRRAGWACRTPAPSHLGA
jgi:hypothetical protein